MNVAEPQWAAERGHWLPAYKEQYGRMRYSTAQGCCPLLYRIADNTSFKLIVDLDGYEPQELSAHNEHCFTNYQQAKAWMQTVAD